MRQYEKGIENYITKDEYDYILSQIPETQGIYSNPIGEALRAYNEKGSELRCLICQRKPAGFLVAPR